MPPFECFEDADAYYSTLGHEMTHWTRHPTRLDRDFGRQRFGDPGYAREELVAELGAAFLCADLGLALEPREDHAAYNRSLAPGAQGRQAVHRLGGVSRAEGRPIICIGSSQFELAPASSPGQPR